MVISENVRCALVISEDARITLTISECARSTLTTYESARNTFEIAEIARTTLTIFESVTSMFVISDCVKVRFGVLPSSLFQHNAHPFSSPCAVARFTGICNVKTIAYYRFQERSQSPDTPNPESIRLRLLWKSNSLLL